MTRSPRTPRPAPAPAPARAARPAPRLALAGLLSLVLPAALGCAGDGRGVGTRIATPAEQAARIAELEARIDEDHATLERLVATPRGPEDPPLYDDPVLRAIAARLSDRERELAGLRAALQPEAAPAR